MSDQSGSPRHRPVVLTILDGWGYREAAPDNAISGANPPVYKNLWDSCPHGLLVTSGTEVGLPAGQMGNSEVGHLNIGTGRIVVQDLPRISEAVADGSIANNAAIRNLIENVRAANGVCHLLGLVSPGGVHSHQEHALALANIVSRAGVRTAIHAFTDGRDTPPRSAREYLVAMCRALPKTAAVATVCGRYYAMDRDNRWERVERAYRAVVAGEGKCFASADDVIATSYDEGVSDEFVVPAIVGEYKGMQDGDAVLCFNFRPDRVRELLSAILVPSFSGFTRARRVELSASIGLTHYAEQLDPFIQTAFPAQELNATLGEVVSDAGLTQLRLAETEKYPHVTYFLNGGREKPYRDEDRILVSSPKVATYDLQPEMSARELTDRAVEAIASRKYDLIVMNYANGDMVGHTGNYRAAVKAVEAVDIALGRLGEALRSVDGCMLITADHGNCEDMHDEENDSPHTAHTTNLVPVILVGENSYSLRSGRLSDVAPTVLDLLRLPKPLEMTGNSLLRAVSTDKALGRELILDTGKIYPWEEIATRLMRARTTFPRSRLWLVRHGETKFNVEDRISGQSETHLTERGRDEAVSMRAKLPSSLDRVFCSALERAVETMSLALPAAGAYSFVFPNSNNNDRLRQIVARNAPTPWERATPPPAVCDVFFDARLNEISFGDLEGQSRGKLGPYREDDIDLAPPGGESYRDFAQRIFSAITDALLMGRNDAEEIAFFAHSGTMRVVRSLLTQYGTLPELFGAKPPTGAIANFSLGETSLPRFWTDVA